MGLPTVANALTTSASGRRRWTRSPAESLPQGLPRIAGSKNSHVHCSCSFGPQRSPVATTSIVPFAVERAHLVLVVSSAGDGRWLKCGFDALDVLTSKRDV
jgi:hypothetical protein